MSDSKPTIVPLDRSRLGDAAELLVDAFYDDPMAAYMVPDESKRRGKLRQMMRRFLSYGMLYGHVETTEDFQGLAAWIPPEYVKFNFWRMLRSGMIVVPWILGRAAAKRFSQAMAEGDRLHAKHAPGQHWYLFILAVGPHTQRSGVGTALIQHGLARIDRQGLPCYLETTSQKNVEYYPRHGFDMVEETSVGNGLLNVWGFLRQPGNEP
ncbi:MAG: GNAT family N-acetyltransferase [Planctomycetota bacterium]|nr:GNAT family N-acetyltransferase [Planctomycetota bacterium]